MDSSLLSHGATLFARTIDLLSKGKRNRFWKMESGGGGFSSVGGEMARYRRH